LKKLFPCLIRIKMGEAVANLEEDYAEVGGEEA